MADITMCKDESCPKKETCYRYKATPCEYMQSYFASSPRKEEECEEYWECKDKSTLRRLDVQTKDLP